MRTIRNIGSARTRTGSPPAGISPLVAAAAIALASAIAYPSLTGGAERDAAGPRDRAAQVICPG